eukprot:m.486831 g.486831  ORF g.486831 m.486831 type:complete len:52 (-) comp79870_c0_seq1:299-454(-)
MQTVSSLKGHRDRSPCQSTAFDVRPARIGYSTQYGQHQSMVNSSRLSPYAN